jgi:SH3-like domain-containing protein
VKDIRGPYFQELEEAERPREHWRGIDPKDGRTEWLFQTVEDGGRRIAIRQMIVHPDGAIDRLGTSWST